MSDFPKDIGEMISKHPLTGEKLELLSIEATPESPPPEPQPEPPEKVIPPEFQSIGVADVIDQNGWSLSFTATEIRGLNISNVFFRDVHYIFFLTVPWIGKGSPCDLEQFFLNERISGPFVLNFPNGFAIWARYGFGNGDTLDQAFYFFDDGTMLPLMLHTGPTSIDFVPLYIDFDIINTLNTVCNFFPPGVANTSWNLAVSEFSRQGAGATPPDGSYNMMITNCTSDLKARAIVEFNPEDNAVQYVARWQGYNIDAFPLLNLRGLEIVNADIVYVYLINNPPEGFFGPTVRLQTKQRNCYK
jgi:hypothetical protein